MYIIDNYLNNSGIDTSHVEDVEMTNEGYTLNGGVESILLESDEATHKMNMLQIGMESKGVMMLHEASKNGENQEEALLRVNMLMEKVSFGIIEKIKEVVIKMWTKMKEIVNSLKMAIAKAFSESKYIQLATEALKDLNNFTDFEYSGYNYNLNYDLKAKWQKANDVAVKAFKTLENSTDTNAIKTGIEKAKNAEAMDSYCNAGYGCKVSELEKTVFKALRGGDVKITIKTIDKDAAIKLLNEFKSAQADISSIAKSIDDSHKEVIASIDNLITARSKEIKNAKPGTDNSFNNAIVGLYQAKASVVKEVLNISNRVTGYKMSALKEEKAQAKAMVSKAIAVGKKNKKKSMGKLNASTEFFLDESYLYDDCNESYTNSNSYSSNTDFIDGLLSNI